MPCRKFLLGIVLLSTAACNYSLLASTLDQAIELAPGPGGPQAIIYADPSGRAVNHAQTFTVGILGQLDRVDILLAQIQFPAALIVDIRPTVGGVPLLDDSSALATFTLSSSMVPQFNPGWVSLDFSSHPIFVTPGEQLALVLRTTTAPSGVEYHWAADQGNPYAAGSAFYRSPVEGQWMPVRGGSPVVVDEDYGIRTFVTVPEPGTLGLLGVAGLALLLHRQRRPRC